MNGLSFDEILKSILTVLDIKYSRLAKAINVDPSLVNRWIHGVRLPPHDSNYIDGMSIFINANIHNSFQTKAMEDILSTTGVEVEQNFSMLEKIRKNLLEARGYSDGTSRSVKSDTLINSKIKVSKSNPSIAKEKKTLEIIPKSTILELNSDDKIIIGKENMLKVMLRIFNLSVRQPVSPNSKPIYITLMDEGLLNFIDDKCLSHFGDILQKALEKKLRINIIFQINNNFNRILKLLYIINFVSNHDLIQIFYITKYDVLSYGKEIYILPGGVLSCYSASTDSGIDCAFYLTNPVAMDIFIRHLDKMIYNLSRPLIKYFPVNNYSESIKIQLQYEKLAGEKLQYLDKFSEMTFNDSLYADFISNMDPSSTEINVVVDNHKKQRKAFCNNLKFYGCKEIYIRESLEKYISTGKFSFNNFNNGKEYLVSKNKIIMHLKNVIKMLEKYEKYEIAIISENLFPKGNKINISIKEWNIVNVMKEEHNRNIHNTNFFIDETTIVNTFQKIFMDTWNGISPVCKEKQNVTNWLNSQIKMLSDAEAYL